MVKREEASERRREEGKGRRIGGREDREKTGRERR